MIRFLSNVIGFLWFFLLYDIIILMGTVKWFEMLGNIFTMVEQGWVSIQPDAFTTLLIVTFFYAVTEWVPSFRKCYIKMPWLYSFCTFLLANIFIFSVTEWILVKGLSVIITSRYVITIIIAIVQIFLFKYFIGKYFWNHKEDLRKFEEYD